MLCISFRDFALVLNCSGGGVSAALPCYIDNTRHKTVNGISWWKLFLHPFLTLCIVWLDLESYLKE